MRVFQIDPENIRGFTKRGELINSYELNLSNTDDYSTGSLELLVKETDTDIDYTRLLSPGKFVRLVHYMVDNEFPFLKDENGRPKNYSDWYIPNGKNKLWDCIARKIKQNNEKYGLYEPIYCLSDYPVRTSKTFTVGMYTFKEVLDICFKLFFKPRYLAAEFRIPENYALNEPNSELNYTNATLYDVVFDIGRQLDLRPYMELDFENGKYIFTLRFRDKAGTAGEMDISFFNWADVVSTAEDRSICAGNVISYVDNMITTTDNVFPAADKGVYPTVTNEEGSWSVFRTPNKIRELKEVRVYWKWTNNKGTSNVTIGELQYDDPIIITPTGNIGQQAYSGNDGGRFPHDDPSFGWPKKDLYLAEESEFRYLYDVDDLQFKNKRTTIHYTKGEDTISLDALKDTHLPWYSVPATSAETAGLYRSVRITLEPDTRTSFNSTVYPQTGFPLLWAVSITYIPFIDSLLDGENGDDSDVTVYFNQYGQVVDSNAFGRVVKHYAGSMGPDKKRGKVLPFLFNNRNEWYKAFDAVPPLNTVVKDGENRYVITNESVYVNNGGIQLIVQLNPYVAGRSRFITANSDLTIYGIPDNGTQVSKSYEHFVYDLSLSPIPQKEIMADYLNDGVVLSALLSERQMHRPQNVLIDFYDKEGNELAGGTIIQACTFAETGTDLLLNHVMLNNRMVGVKGDKYILYTDDKGKFERVRLRYIDVTGEYAAEYPEWNDVEHTLVCEYFEDVSHDAREIYNQTTIIGFNGLNGLQIGSGLISLSGMLNNEAGDLWICFYSTKKAISSDPEENTGAIRKLTAVLYDEYIEFAFSELPEDYQYESWGILRNNYLLLIDNYHKLTYNGLKIYYSKRG